MSKSAAEQNATTAVDSLKQRYSGDATPSRALTDASVGALLAGSQGPDGAAYLSAFGKRAAGDNKLMQQLGLDNFSIGDLSSHPEQVQGALAKQGIRVESGTAADGTPTGKPISVVYDSNDRSTTYVDDVGNAQSFKKTDKGVEVITNGITRKYDNASVELNKDGTPKLDDTEHMPIIQDQDGNEIRVRANGPSETKIMKGDAAGTTIYRSAAGDVTRYTSKDGKEDHVIGRDATGLPTIDGKPMENATAAASVEVDPKTGKPFYELPSTRELNGPTYRIDIDPATGKMQTIHGTDGTSIALRDGHWYNDQPATGKHGPISELLTGPPEVIGSPASLVRMKWARDRDDSQIHILR